VIALVDYGMGNLRSVAKAVENLGGRIKIVSNPGPLKRADKILLPGVGAFPDAVRELKRRRLWEPLKRLAREGRPLMGICLGYQLLFTSSTEGGRLTRGLDLIPGTVRRFKFSRLKHRGYKVPHMGWNQLELQRPSPLLRGIRNKSFFYFVHSYYPEPRRAKDILARTLYGHRFASAVERGNLSGFQFHPEKSQSAGLRILSNFIHARPPAGGLKAA
jgi:glutamine amidotransferase